MIDPRPHDLLRVESLAELCMGGPAWLASALGEAPWVVVRRGRCAPGQVPVGIRGPSRSHRHASVVEIDSVAEVLTPADLVERIDRLPDVAVTATLRQCAALLGPTGLRWGPTGSVGFTLATGVLAVTTSSDLDLVLTVEDVPPATMLAELREAFRGLPARVDCQLDLPIGGVALDDVLDSPGQVLVRTVEGPSLMSVGQLTS
jgi:phosphoribosyl-dephospho-CoA transferase